MHPKNQNAGSQSTPTRHEIGLKKKRKSAVQTPSISHHLPTKKANVIKGIISRKHRLRNVLHCVVFTHVTDPRSGRVHEQKITSGEKSDSSRAAETLECVPIYLEAIIEGTSTHGQQTTKQRLDTQHSASTNKPNRSQFHPSVSRLRFCATN